eukprot:GHVS01005936.1.p2 GENE.GHVS01005936.1~~GHVS01005936.1.p2  ORF type:complete len:106 (+),score=13.74 GHVS01005936.1:304-621(+)
MTKTTTMKRQSRRLAGRPAECRPLGASPPPVRLSCSTLCLPCFQKSHVLSVCLEPVRTKQHNQTNTEGEGGQVALLCACQLLYTTTAAEEHMGYDEEEFHDVRIM